MGETVSHSFPAQFHSWPGTLYSTSIILVPGPWPWPGTVLVTGTRRTVPARVPAKFNSNLINILLLLLLLLIVVYSKD